MIQTYNTFAVFTMTKNKYIHMGTPVFPEPLFLNSTEIQQGESASIPFLSLFCCVIGDRFPDKLAYYKPFDVASVVTLLSVLIVFPPQSLYGPLFYVLIVNLSGYTLKSFSQAYHHNTEFRLLTFLVTLISCQNPFLFWRVIFGVYLQENREQMGTGEGVHCYYSFLSPFLCTFLVTILFNNKFLPKTILRFIGDVSVKHLVCIPSDRVHNFLPLRVC